MITVLSKTFVILPIKFVTFLYEQKQLANIMFVNTLPQGIASLYLKLKHSISKLQATAASIDFIHKIL